MSCGETVMALSGRSYSALLVAGAAGGGKGASAATLDQEPRTVVLVTHDVDEARRTCERVAVLSPRPGSLLLDAPSSHLSHDDVMEALRS